MATIVPRSIPSTNTTTLVMFDNKSANNDVPRFVQTITTVTTPRLGYTREYREFTTVANVTYWITG
jgi:hypothetical protein